MNECELYQELISRLVDGELNRDEYAALNKHMENCSECSAMYAVFASLSDIIGGEDEPLPEDLHENIMAGVRRSAIINNNRRRLSKPVRNALAAAACAALVLFAARGLSPAERAEEAVLTKSEAAVMDMAAEEARPEEAAAAQAESPAAQAQPGSVPSQAPAPTATARPTATPVPTKDVYLNSDTDETNAGTGSANKNDDYSVVVTVPPTPVVVDTPGTVSTASSAPAATAAPVATETPAPQTQAPAQESVEPATANEGSGTAAQSEHSPAPAAETEASGKVQPAAESNAAATAAPAESTPAVTEPVETDPPLLQSMLFALFGRSRTEDAAVEGPTAEIEAAAESLMPAPTAEPAATVSPAPAAEEAPAEAEDEAEDESIKLESLEKLTELENLLDGEEAELPEAEADAAYSFVLAQPEEGLEDYELKVLFFGETVYYVQVLSQEESIICLSKCTVEELEKFIETLVKAEDAGENGGHREAAEPSPSPDAAAESPEPTATAGVGAETCTGLPLAENGNKNS